MIRGCVFDKDGTLFDFNATWGLWSRKMMLSESHGDPVLLARLARVMGYDLTHEVFLPGAIVIAETVDVVAEAILKTTGQTDLPALVARMNAASSEVPQVPVTDLATFFADFSGRGLRLGIATNDGESPARRHLEAQGILHLFDFVAGYDSGYGGKPAPGQLHGFCTATGLDPAACIMVGDSLHDLSAGRAAGMRTVGVLTGPAPASELAPLADVVLDSIVDLPAWIDSQS